MNKPTLAIGLTLLVAAALIAVVTLGGPQGRDKSEARNQRRAARQAQRQGEDLQSGAPGQERRQPRAAGGQASDMMLLQILPRLGKQLELTDEQKEELKTIMASLREENADERELVQTGSTRLTEVLLANPEDVPTAAKVVDEQLAAERAMKMNGLNATAEALKVLTPEQRTKLAELMKKGVERQRRGGGGGEKRQGR